MKCPFVFTLCLIGGMSVALHAADAPPAKAATAAPATAKKAVAMNPQVQTILDASAKFYAERKSFEADLDSETKMNSTGMKQEFESTFHLALSRPSSFALTLQSGMMGGSLVCDGKTCITSQPMLKKYTSTDAPGKLADLFEPMRLVMAVGGLSLGFENLLSADPSVKFQAGLEDSEDLGTEAVGGAKAHHVRLKANSSITELWIADGAQPLLLKAQVSPDMSGAFKHLSADQKKKLPAGFDSMTMVRTTTYSNWKIDQPVDASAFKFQPPPDSQLVTEFVAQPKHPLTGKPAPGFKLDDLDGKPVSLASLHGKVVVLDFWATWCGPCVASLPDVTAVTKSFADRGVVFYAVNLRESADVIRKFQADKHLNFPVLLDTKGDVAGLYKATGIPQTVLIDAQGNIQTVHVGYDPGIKKILTGQLTDLLAGKSLEPAGK